MADDQNNDILSNLLKKYENHADDTPEAGAAFQKKLQEMEGTMFEWASLQENGEICVKITGWLKGGARGDNSYTLKPENDEYKERKSKHRLEKPGDSSTIKKQWIDEKWVEVVQEN
ncbi:MAG TPA: hypothetical protein PKD05_04980 [Candidatus Melainabacteria bacterium]|nr:hypothetical protein [Candidatus Melainabacteria bacterium]